MEHTVNATRRILRNDPDSSSESEENLINDDNSDDIIFEPTNLHYESSKRWFKVFSYFTFSILGILTLLPWYAFSTATDYWMYKFRNVSQVSTNRSYDGNRTDLQAEFTSYLSISSTGPSLIFLIINLMCTHRISSHSRIIGSLVIMLVLFIITTALVYVNTDSWQNVFFIITLMIAIITNIFSGILQASVWAVASKFSSVFISVATKGQALAGIFVSLVCIISLDLSAASTTSATIYFSFAIITVLLGLISYICLSRSVHFKYTMLHRISAKELTYDPSEVNETTSAFVPPELSIKRILSKIWCYGLSVAVCFIVTLSVFPAVTVLISPKTSTGPKYDKFFVPLVAFLLFSVFDYIGRSAKFISMFMQIKSLLLSLSFLRVIFVPLILLCNAQPRRNLPVLIGDDNYAIITMLFGLTNGLVTNGSLVNYRSVIRESEKDVASSLMAVFLGFGCAAGSALSFLMLRLL